MTMKCTLYAAEQALPPMFFDLIVAEPEPAATSSTTTSPPVQPCAVAITTLKVEIYEFVNVIEFVVAEARVPSLAVMTPDCLLSVTALVLAVPVPVVILKASLAAKVVKLPAAAVFPPTAALSTVPPLMSTVVTVPRSLIVELAKLYVPALKVAGPTALAGTWPAFSVKVPADTSSALLEAKVHSLAPPIVTPSMVPPLMSAVVTVPRFEIVEPEKL